MIALSFVGMVVGACTLYAILWVFQFGDADNPPGLITLWSSPEVVPILTNLGEVTVAVLGIALTVVAILVQLAAYRYTPRITDLFVRDPVNMLTIGYFVVTSVLVIWVNMSLHGPEFPSVMAIALVVAISVAILGLLPYFAYIFVFLAPDHIIGQIRREAESALRTVTRRGAGAVPAARQELLTSIEQLDDMAQNAVKKDDNGIAIRALAALVALLDSHLRLKPSMPEAWFETAALPTADPDFVALDPIFKQQLTERRLWVEMKILRGLELTFRHTLQRLPDIAHLVAIHARDFVERTLEHDDERATELTLRYFNTYLRHALNASDVRVAYNVLNEYRQVAEHMMTVGHYEAVVRIADRFKYYGHIAFHRGLSFVIETAAQDIAELLERAHVTEAPCHDALLAVFLEVDREPHLDSTQQEVSARGVRKAQVKMATFYLEAGAAHYARLIFDDMRHESPVRLRSIWQELAELEDPEWWEVANRSINWDYLPPSQRARLGEFFGWFDSVAPALPTEP